MINLKLLLVSVFSLLWSSTLVFGQNRAYVHKVVSRLASGDMHGRGYYKEGDHKAARFIARELHKSNLIPLWNNYLQEYHFNINTFPGKVRVWADGRRLSPGKDFVVHPSIGPVDATYKLLWMPDTLSKPQSIYDFVDTTNLEGIMPVLPKKAGGAYRNGLKGIPSLVQLDDNIWWHVSRKQWDQGKIAMKIHPDQLKPGTSQLRVKVDARLMENRPAYNVGAMVRGHIQPDSFVVFVAHYDHLGRMGHEAVFPGASDNASGTAAVLDLAKYYANNPHKAHYSMVFLLVSGEEAGLLGSRFFSENPPFELSKTRFVINFDMVGTGSEALNVFNANANKAAFDLLQFKNNQNKWFTDLRPRGASCNSDHCPFHQKGIPAFFLLTSGPENKHYHNIYDRPELLPFTSYEQLFQLVTAFVDDLPHLKYQKPSAE